MIPTYNEVENIKKLLESILREIRRLRKHSFVILVVDDNSPDGTGEIVEGLKKKNKIIKLLNGKKEGLGKAMRRGYLYAMKEFKPEVIIANEADFAVPFKHLGYMIKKIEEGYDVVVASRHVVVGKAMGWTTTRKLNHFMANTLFATWIAGVKIVHDKNMAFKAVRVKGVLDSIDLKKFNVRGFAFFYFFVYRLSQVTVKFYEFPVVYKFRTQGESKVSFNPKYLRNYIRDIKEYVLIAFKIRFRVL